MKQYLLDTNIVAFLFRGKYGVKERLKSIGYENCHISIITYAELRYGCECSNNFQKSVAVLDAFCQMIDVVGIDLEIVNLFAEKKAQLRKKGTTVDDFDLLIGSTAICKNMTVVTENLKHLERIESISIENWINR